MANTDRNQPFESIKESKLIIVEGEGDKRFFKALLKDLKISHTEVRQLGGKSGIKKGFPSLVKMASFRKVKKVIIVRDADNNPIGAFQSISSTLSNVGLTVPDRPYKFSADDPSTMAIIIPDDNKNGALENLCLDSVQDDPAMECVNSFMDCIEEKLQDQPNNLSKSKIQAFLATRENPELQIGEAADAGYWNFDSQIYDKLKSALHKL